MGQTPLALIVLENQGNYTNPILQRRARACSTLAIINTPIFFFLPKDFNILSTCTHPDGVIYRAYGSRVWSWKHHLRRGRRLNISRHVQKRHSQTMGLRRKLWKIHFWESLRIQSIKEAKIMDLYAQTSFWGVYWKYKNPTRGE